MINTRFSLHYFLLFTMIATVSPYVQVFLRARGFSDAEVGQLQGIMALAGTLGPIVIGHLGDRFGRRSTMLGCLLVSALFPPLLSVTSHFSWAAILIACMGFLGRTAIPLTETLAATELRDPPRDYGKVRVWGSVGFVVALLGIGWLKLVDESSSTSMMRAMVITIGICMISARLLPDHHQRAAQKDVHGAPEAGFDGVLWLFFGVVATQQIGMSAYYFFFTNYLRDVHELPQAAWVWALGALAETPFLFCGGAIIRRFGIRWMLIAAMGAAAVRFTIYASGPPLSVILSTQILHGLTFGLLHAASIEFLRKKIPPNRRAFGMALYMSLPIGVSSLVGGSLGGMVVERLGYAQLYSIYSIPPLLGALVVLAFGRRFDRVLQDSRESLA